MKEKSLMKEKKILMKEQIGSEDGSLGNKQAW